jgi:hypothetical protein
MTSFRDGESLNGLPPFEALFRVRPLSGLPWMRTQHLRTYTIPVCTRDPSYFGLAFFFFEVKPRGAGEVEGGCGVEGTSVCRAAELLRSLKHDSGVPLPVDHGHRLLFSRPSTFEQGPHHNSIIASSSCFTLAHSSACCFCSLVTSSSCRPVTSVRGSTWSRRFNDTHSSPARRRAPF